MSKRRPQPGRRYYQPILILSVAVATGLAVDYLGQRPGPMLAEEDGLLVQRVKPVVESGRSEQTLVRFGVGGASQPRSVDPLARAALLETYRKRSLAFEVNRGQAGARVQFLSHSGGYTLYLMASEAALALRPSSGESALTSSEAGSLSAAGPVKDQSPIPDAATPTVLRMRLVGANSAQAGSGEELLPGKVNYLIGDDPRRWQTGIPTYARVNFQNVYPGIDLVYHGNGGQLEYDFVVKPGADPRRIAVAFGGASRCAIDDQGNLRIEVRGRQVLLHQPRIYQSDAKHRGRRQSVAGRYALRAGQQVKFQLGPYDPTRPLIIDPVLAYSTYLGGSAYDSGAAVAVDSSGSAYVTGFTLSDNLPTTAGAFDLTCGTAGSCNGGFSDVFVTKFSPSGSSLVYSTYIGGSKDEIGRAIAVDSSGNAYVAGETFSSDFPTTSGAFDRTYAGAGDAFVLKLSANGSALVYSTFLGGSATDEACGVAVDSLGDAYVTGRTYSTNFPTASPIQASNGGNNDADAFVTELNAAGSSLVYSTYLGGSGPDKGAAIAVDAAGNAYVTGFTKSTDFPLASAVQTTCVSCPGYADAFAAEITTNGAGLVASTYLGGGAEDNATGVALDGAGNVYVVGFTFSTNFPTTAGAYQTTLTTASGAFVTKFAPSLSSVLYSTYVHGNGLDFGQTIAVDTGNAFVAGQTFSTSFPLANALQSTCRSSSCYYGTGFATELNGAGSGLVFSTYLGGTYIDQSTGIALDSSANPYIVGEAGSTDFPTASAFQSVFAGSYADAFVSNVALTPAVSLSTTSLTFPSQPVGTTSGAQTVTLNSNGTAPVHIASITVSGDFGQTNTCDSGASAGSTCAINVTFTPTATGTRNGTVTITDNAGGSPQTVTLTGTGGSGTGPAVALAPTSLTFNSQLVGTTSAPQPVTLTNSGNAALTINSIGISGANASDFAQSNNCPGSLAANASCTINVTFTPTAAGARSASVSIADNAPGSPQAVSLSGTGTAPAPAVTLSPTSLTFNSQLVGTTSAAQPVTLTNSGNAALTINSIGISGANVGDFAQSNNCPGSLAANSGCTINVTFTPSAAGSRSASVSISDNAPGSPQAVGLAGTGSSGSPGVTLSPTSLTFNSQQVGMTSASQPVTLTNSGNAALTISSVGISGANAGDFAQSNNCPSSLAASANCTINVTFTPTAPLARAAALSIADNATGSPQTVNLAGTGVGPLASLSPTSLTFAKQAIGTTSPPQTVTLTNTGNGAMTINTITITGSKAGDFAQSNNCVSASPIAANASCTISVTFKPTAKGNRTASLSVSDSAPGSPQTVSLSGTGGK
ncbi:MAG TPA: choice-of-anchor D domain-containing protein [Terriglobia bacterium]|nr:choice-of-anchor D domain-containing protein [Terriglobia bacterium]